MIIILCNCCYFSAKLSEIFQPEPSEIYKRVLKGGNNGDQLSAELSVQIKQIQQITIQILKGIFSLLNTKVIILVRMDSSIISFYKVNSLTCHIQFTIGIRTTGCSYATNTHSRTSELCINSSNGIIHKSTLCF